MLNASPRRNTTGAVAGILSCLLLCAPLLAADRVPVTGGIVEGITGTTPGVRLFRAIPFAAPPVGPRRWQPPAPVEPWDGVYKADTWGKRCMQGQMFQEPLVTRDAGMSEDCLTLNVWTPAESAAERLPVLFVIHGGGFAAGSAAEPRTDGEWFARQGIVVVEANHRLGVFGFLAHPQLSAESNGRGSGNYGMLDQLAALRWVRENIAAFGGDPDDITINGESAGSMSVSALMASPLSKTLVSKAIGQSGSFFTRPREGLALQTLAEKEQTGVRLVASLDLESLDELRRMPADVLLAAVMQQNGGWGYHPGIDGYFLPTTVKDIYARGEQAHIPLLAGWTSSELGMSVSMNPRKPTVNSFRDQLAEIFGDQADAAAKVYAPASDAEAPAVAAALASDRFMGYTTWKWINVHAATGNAPVWRYRFDRVVPGDPLGEFGAAHASDIEYAFHTLASKDANWQAGDRDTADTMATAFANFVKTGNPNGAGVPTWPEFGATGKVMYLDASSQAGPAEFDERYEFLDTVVPK